MPENQPFRPGFSLAGAVDLDAIKHQVKAEPGQEGGAPKAGGYVVDVNENTFQAVLQSSTTYPVLIFFWVATDDRCVKLAEQLANAVNGLSGKIQLARIDVAENARIAQAMQVQAAPALYAIISGRPLPVFQGLPSDSEMEQVTSTVIPELLKAAEQSGVTGTAPYIQAEGEDAPESEEAQVPAAHRTAHDLAAAGEYAQAAAEYEKVIETDSTDTLAVRERAKALLLARSANANVRVVREAAASNPDSLEAQLAVADVDMIGGQIEDAFGRLLDYAQAHREDINLIRERLLEYFVIPDAGDERVKRARMRLMSLLY